jgi:hypothetical protein
MAKYYTGGHVVNPYMEQYRDIYSTGVSVLDSQGQQNYMEQIGANLANVAPPTPYEYTIPEDYASLYTSAQAKEDVESSTGVQTAEQVGDIAMDKLPGIATRIATKKGIKTGLQEAGVQVVGKRALKKGVEEGTQYVTKQTVRQTAKGAGKYLAQEGTEASIQEIGKQVGAGLVQEGVQTAGEETIKQVGQEMGKVAARRAARKAAREGGAALAAKGAETATTTATGVATGLSGAATAGISTALTFAGEGAERLIMKGDTTPDKIDARDFGAKATGGALKGAGIGLSAGALAASFAAAGSALPGIGTAVGAVLGTLVGLFKARRAKKKMSQEQAKLGEQRMKEEREEFAQIESFEKTKGAGEEFTRIGQAQEESGVGILGKHGMRVPNKYGVGGMTPGNYSHKTNPLTAYKSGNTMVLVNKNLQKTDIELTGGEGVFDKPFMDNIHSLKNQVNTSKNKETIYAQIGKNVINEMDSWPEHLKKAKMGGMTPSIQNPGIMYNEPNVQSNEVNKIINM